MKILVACRLPENALEELRGLGATVAYEPEQSGEELARSLADVAILIVGRQRVSREMIAGSKQLQLIVRDGTGTLNIAVDEASTQGIFVTHCLFREAAAIAEMTMGLLVLLDRQLLDQSQSDGAGVSRRADDIHALGLVGRTLGILNYGPVGREVALRARGFGMNVLACAGPNREMGTPEWGVEFANSPRELARRCDAICVYVPLDDAKERFISPEFVSQMRSPSLLAYIGHPNGLDEPALHEAVQAGRVRAALDLYSSEAAGEVRRHRSLLKGIPGAVVTHRLADATERAREVIAAEVTRIVRQFLVAGDVSNCINMAEHSDATWQILLRLKDAVGVMASVMDEIRSDGVNAQEIACRVFQGGRAAWASIALSERPSAECLANLRGLTGVMHVDLRAIL